MRAKASVARFGSIRGIANAKGNNVIQKCVNKNTDQNSGLFKK